MCNTYTVLPDPIKQSGSISIIIIRVENQITLFSIVSLELNSFNIMNYLENILSHLSTCVLSCLIVEFMCFRYLILTRVSQHLIFFFYFL